MSNHFTITGNLGRDGLGALRFTPSGQAVLGFSIADTPRRRNAAGEWEDAGDTLWVEVSVWGEDAEALAEVRGVPSLASYLRTPSLPVTVTRPRWLAWFVAELRRIEGREGSESAPPRAADGLAGSDWHSGTPATGEARKSDESDFTDPAIIGGRASTAPTLRRTK